MTMEVQRRWVQVHPTGLVKPNDLDAKSKILAAEKLLGVVTGEMWKNKHPFRPAPNKATSDDVAWECKHYTGRGVMKLNESGAAFAGDMGVLVSKMKDSIKAHIQASLKMAQDPDG